MGGGYRPLEDDHNEPQQPERREPGTAVGLICFLVLVLLGAMCVVSQAQVVPGIVPIVQQRAESIDAAFFDAHFGAMSIHETAAYYAEYGDEDKRAEWEAIKDGATKAMWDLGLMPDGMGWFTERTPAAGIWGHLLLFQIPVDLITGGGDLTRREFFDAVRLSSDLANEIEIDGLPGSTSQLPDGGKVNLMKVIEYVHDLGGQAEALNN